MAEVVAKLLFDRLIGISTSRKLRLTAFELAALAFLLRVSPTVTSRKRIPAGHLDLLRKIENYRRRARRAAIKRNGEAAYESAAGRWKQFLNWMRFNLIYPPKAPSWSPRRVWRERREGLARLITTMLEHYRYEPLTDSEMRRIVRLFKEELRRGRHPVTLRELLNSEPETRYEFLFGVLRKKLELRPTASATFPLDILLSNRADRFRNRDLARLTGRHPRSSETDMPSPPALPRPANLIPLSVDSIVPEANLPTRVADWFNREVAPNLWSQLRDESIFRLTRIPDLRVPRTAAPSIEDVIERTRPQIADEDRNFSLAELNFFADWALGLDPRVNRRSQPSGHRDRSRIRAGRQRSIRT
jgi:hypothetical protein